MQCLSAQRSNMKSVIAFLFVLGVNVYLTLGKQLPSYVKKCSLQDPQLNECLRKAFMDMKPHVRHGNKELRIPPLDPYTVPSIKLSTSWMNCTLSNSSLTSAYDYEIVSIKFDLKNNPRIVVVVKHPGIIFTGHYVLDGKILQFNLHGEGKYETHIDYMMSTVSVDGKIIRKKDKEYLELDQSTAKIAKYALKHVYLHDLFANNPELTERINKIFLDDYETYTVEVLPLMENLMAEVVMTLLKGTMDRFSLDELFD